MKTSGILLVIAMFATTTHAVEVGKWRTPKGSIYIGATPPEGSERLGSVDLGAPGAERAAPDPAPAPLGEGIVDRLKEAREEERAAREAAARELDSKLRVVAAQTTFRAGRNFVTGQVSNGASIPARGVRVGIEGDFVSTRPSTIPPGEVAEFSLSYLPSSVADRSLQLRHSGRRAPKP